MSNQPKKWWTSKTIWINGLTLTIALIATVTQAEFLQEHPHVIAYLLLASSMLNVGLRFITGQPLEK